MPPLRWDGRPRERERQHKRSGTRRRGCREVDASESAASSTPIHSLVTVSDCIECTGTGIVHTHSPQRSRGKRSLRYFSLNPGSSGLPTSSWDALILFLLGEFLLNSLGKNKNTRLSSLWAVHSPSLPLPKVSEIPILS